MDDTEQLRDDESNKHLETYVREQSAVRLQVIFCAITVVIGPIIILVGAWGTPGVSLFAAFICLIILIRGIFAWNEYKKITRTIHSLDEPDRIPDYDSKQ